MARRKPMTKKASNSVHARRRALERYGISLNKFARSEIIKKIQKGGYKYFIDRTSNSKGVFQVPYGKIFLRVVYDKIRKSIVTVLPIKGNEKQKV